MVFFLIYSAKSQSQSSVTSGGKRIASVLPLTGTSGTPYSRSANKAASAAVRRVGLTPSMSSMAGILDGIAGWSRIAAVRRDSDVSRSAVWTRLGGHGGADVGDDGAVVPSSNPAREAPFGMCAHGAALWKYRLVWLSR